MTPFRDAIATTLAATPHQLPPAQEYRGIVIPAGGPLYGALAYHLVTCLRGLGCRLPIEVWHLDASEMPEDVAGAFSEFDGVRLVSAVDVCQTLGHVPRRRNASQRDRGWWLKAFALRHAGFVEVMLLDADNVPAADPTYLLDDIAYQRAGAMFWPDLPPPRTRDQWVPDAAWQAVGLEPVPAARPFESGQILVRRDVCVRALDLAVMLNEWSDVTYQFVYGDKDCFLLAWHLAGSPYHMPAKNPRWRHPAICQHDSAGELVFQHACAAKEAISAGELFPSIVSRRFAPDAAAAFKAARMRWIYRDGPQPVAS